LKEEGQHRTSILLGTWNRDKHIEWMNKNPKKKPSANIKQRQYEKKLEIFQWKILIQSLDLFHCIIPMVMCVN
jgi:hypothetical protein